MHTVVSRGCTCATCEQPSTPKQQTQTKISHLMWALSVDIHYEMSSQHMRDIGRGLRFKLVQERRGDVGTRRAASIT